MPNWCFASYVIEGDKKEVDELEQMMNRLRNMEKPAVDNGFGTDWLGCIVHELGGDWERVRCRGSWSDLERTGEHTVRFNTETAWAPCNETFDLVCKHFTSLRYYYLSEEPGLCEFWTNDVTGRFFPERYHVDLCTPKEEYESEYFKTLEDALSWLRERFSADIKSLEDVDELCDEWEKESSDAFCNVYEFRIDMF
ncbi:MAG: hypothetical protein IJK46_08145 [Prevotella sp.]|nr:hypothetical protein [Prevotella sp.]